MLSDERDFTWRDGERIVRFGRGVAAQATRELAKQSWPSYRLLSTPRALADAPEDLLEGAESVHEVPGGPVNETAAAILGEVGAGDLVAFGGGRVLDTAKAIAAVRGGRVAAIPTTLSGAEMTAIHRLPEGASARDGLVRPDLVIADPWLMVTLPEPKLRASSINALAHGIEPLYTPFANPVATMAALRGAELISDSLDRGRGRAPDELALGSILCAYALDSGLFALHHVLCQSLVRTLRTPHAETNAALLPHTAAAMRDRAPAAISAFAEALGTTREDLGERIEALGGGPRRLSELGAERSGIEAALETTMARAELGFTPDPPEEGEVRSLIETAW